MNKRFVCKLLILIFASSLFVITSVTAQQVRTLTYEDAIEIALNRSYTVKSYEANLQAMEYSFDYYKAMFKPRIDFSMFAPSLDERVSPIQRPDGLPVYNSTGMMRIGSNLRFTYMLPTGGNFALSSQLYRENLKTVLALQNYTELQTDQAYSSLSLSFDQPIFTTNTLQENLEEARYWYERSSSQFTRGQMDIIYGSRAGGLPPGRGDFFEQFRSRTCV